MKTFKDLKHKSSPISGTQARLDFDNGYGVSVIKGPYTYGGRDGLYELAITKDGFLCYNTPITDDVIGYLTPEEVSEIMIKVQLLKNIKFIF